MLQILNLKDKSDKEIQEIFKGRISRGSVNIQKLIIDIIEDVRENGDKALISYNSKFDKVNLEELQVTEEEIKEAFELIDKDLIPIIEESKKNIEDYHKNQKNTGYIYTKELGIFMGQRVIPLDKVGIYVPGGTATYPSTVLMNTVPAKVAGVKEIIMITPPAKNGKVSPCTLVAAKIAGVDKIYKVGGAHGIAALTYGTETVPSVDKIVGPGNMYVTEAKRLVFGDVGIDMIAGPSEIVVIADENSNARFIAADLMSQAEHDKFASSILLTTSVELAQEVIKEVEIMVKTLDREEIIVESLKNFGKIVICESIQEAIKINNLIAPEHLEILLENPMEILGQITNAGSVFLGQYTPEPIGDYFAGTNHVLPTNGTAKFFSPLSVDTFVKKSSYLYYSKEALFENGRKIMRMAEEEGLDAHSNSVKVRLFDESN